MRIIVRIKAGDSWRNQDLDVACNENILELKRRIEKECGYRIHQQLWMKSINQLKDDDTVTGSGISDGDKVFVNVSNTEGEIHVDAESSDKTATCLPKNKEIQSVRTTLPPTTQSDWKCDVCGESCSYGVCECDTCGEVRADHDPQDTQSATIKTTPAQPTPKETLTEDSHGSIATDDSNASERYMTPKNTVGVSSHTNSTINSSELRTYRDEPRVLGNSAVPTYQSSARGIQALAGRSRTNDAASHGGARSKIGATRLDAAQLMDYEWTCTTCGQKNEGQGTEEKCGTCKEPRSTITQTTSDLLVSMGTWICSVCTIENTLDSCKICSKPKPNGTQSASEVLTNNTTTPFHGATAADRSVNRQQAQTLNTTLGETAGIETVQDSPPTDKWICPACTFENALDRPGCEMCTAERPADVGGITAASEQTSRIQEDITNQNGWHCIQCTYVNYPTRPGCVMCAMDRPESYEVPKIYADEVIAGNEEHRIKNCIRNSSSMICYGQGCHHKIKAGEGITLLGCGHSFCMHCLNFKIRKDQSRYLTPECPFISCHVPLQDFEVFEVNKEIERKRDRNRPVSLDVADSYTCLTEYCYGKMNLTLGYIDSFECSICFKTNCMRCRGIHLDCVLCKKKQSTWNKNKKTKAKEAKKNQKAIECPLCGITLWIQDKHDTVRCRDCDEFIDWRKKKVRERHVQF